MDVLISVIIPAHNEEQYIGGTLDALKAQTYRRYEVIVVTNGCTDNTEKIAAGKCDKVLHLDERGLGRARNLGGKKAKGELLLFLDADTLLEPTGLQTIARQFTRKYAMGTLRGVPDTRKLAYRLMYSWKNLLHKSKLHYGSSGVMLCWRDHFQAIGGFDESLYLRENSDLLYKLGKFGKYKYIGKTSATTSMRRYEKIGMLEMVWKWIKIWLVSIFSDLRHRDYEPVR